MFLRPRKTVPALLLLLLAYTGCQNKTDTQSQSKSVEASGPQTFSEAAEQLVTMKNKIRDGFATGNLDAAHGPLHEVGDVLEKIVSLAQKADISTIQLEAVKKATETLFDAFGNIDKTFHGGEGSTYEEESEAIQEAMKVIVEAAGVTDDSESDPRLPPTDDGIPSGEDEVVESGSVPEDSGDNDK